MPSVLTTFYEIINLDMEGLFVRHDLTEQALRHQTEICRELSTLRNVLSYPDAPRIRPSRHCDKPHPCEYRVHCEKSLPEHCVLNLSSITQKRLDALEAMGIQDIRDIPPSFPLTALQDRIRSCVIGNEQYLSTSLKGELMDVEYPIHFLDFETVGTAIPRYAGTRPYQWLPFQWSDHVLLENGSIEHR